MSKRRPVADRSSAVSRRLNGLMYLLGTGCQWRAIPKDLAARSTVYDYFDRWQWDGTLRRIHHALYIKCRRKRRARQPNGSNHRRSERQKRREGRREYRSAWV